MRAIYTDWVDENKGIVTIVSADTPASLNITGVDVEGLPDDFILAAGSVIITPTTNYVAFGEGEFTEKSNGGGSGGGGGMRLYGPYYATNEGGEVLSTTENTYVDLTVLSDYDGNTVTYPSVMGAIMLLNSFTTEKWSVFVLGASAPGDDTVEYGPGFITLENVSGSERTLEGGDVSISFYSTIEFPVVNGD